NREHPWPSSVGGRRGGPSVYLDYFRQWQGADGSGPSEDEPDAHSYEVRDRRDVQTDLRGLEVVRVSSGDVLLVESPANCQRVQEVENRPDGHDDGCERVEYAHPSSILNVGIPGHAHRRILLTNARVLWSRGLWKISSG